ncbi:Cholinesterase [Paramyrothecium foliicola]|nr:Cholinesterase [Paramyrothecium foliicola]
MRLVSIALRVTALAAVTTNALSCRDDLKVRVQGGTLHGTTAPETPGVRQFLGIPYGQPPIKDLRFAPPRPALPFGELAVKELPPSCMQHPINLPSITVNDVLELNLGGLNGTTGPISEDCLSLSVWAPRGSKKKNLPVLMFFYGGAFFGGGTNVPYQLPSQWVQRTQSHIVVSFNHRGNILGFPNAAGLPEEEQNVGLLDQRLAIEWVRDNIAAFGGDPQRIGAWGSSSGAVALAYYSYSYRHDPIVNSLIMGSSNEYVDVLTRDPAHGNFSFVAAQMGCGNLNPQEELSCMRRVDAFTIQDLMQKHLEAGTTPLLTFSPIIDSKTVFDNYTALAEAGTIAKIPALIGSNKEDGVAFVPYTPDGVDTTSAEWATMNFFFCPTYQSAKTRIAANTGPVYRYLYSGNFTNISPRGWMGAWHGADLPLVFGTHPLYRGNSTELEYSTSHAMQDVWLTFVATAGRETTVLGWDAWNEFEGGRVVEFGNGAPVRLIDLTDKEKLCA